MPTPDDLLDFCRRNSGLGEDPDGSNNNFITQWYGLQDAWCAMTVSRACLEAGFSIDGDNLYMPGIALDTAKGWQYVPSMVRKFIDAGQFSSAENDPVYGQVGFVVYPSSGDWTDPTYGTPGDHVNFVESWDSDYVYTWDGNINNKLSSNIWPRSYFYGYGQLPYTQEEYELDKATSEAIQSIAGCFNKFFRGIDNVITGGDDAYSGAINLGYAVGHKAAKWVKGEGNG